MKRIGVGWLFGIAAGIAAGCAAAAIPRGDRDPGVEVGLASFYAHEHHGRTASGAPYDPHALTAAHRSLPFGTRVRVTNLRNQKSVVLTINDRGPFRRGRIIDVSLRAARKLGFVRDGVAKVRVETLE